MIGFREEASESWDDLILGGLKIIQPRRGYRFSIDAVLLAHFPDLDQVSQAIDLGTGTGVIPLLLSHRKPALKITGVEIQPDMVERARQSVQYNRLEERIVIQCQDIKAIPGHMPGSQADLVICNPPFWKAGEGKLNQNREEAIARHEIEVKLADITAAAAHLLKEEGRLAMIHRAERLEEIRKECGNWGLRITRLRMVKSFAADKAKLVLVESCRREEDCLYHEDPPLIIYQAPGIYSQEVESIYNHRIK